MVEILNFPWSHWYKCNYYITSFSYNVTNGESILRLGHRQNVFMAMLKRNEVQLIENYH